MKNIYHFNMMGNNDSTYPPDLIVIEMPHEDFIKLLKQCIDNFDGHNNLNNIQLKGCLTKLKFSPLHRSGVTSDEN
jgi:hypothetical protein